MSNTTDHRDGGYRAQTVPRGIRLKLDMNEGPEPDESWFAAALGSAGRMLAQRYPHSDALEHAIAERIGVPMDSVLVTAGGDEAIERLCRITLGTRAPLLVATPTFEMIVRYAALQGAPVVGVPWGDSDPYPTAPILEALRSGAALLSLVTPNNPTGSVIDRSDAERLIEAARCPVMLDLAYTEFADDDLTDLAMSRPGVVGVRTFSKAWGLAGLRVGYAVGDPDLIGRMRAAGGPFSVSALSRRIALAAWTDANGRLGQTVERVRIARAALSRRLEELGFAVAPSQANFVLARHPAAEAIWSRLVERGVLVRRWTDRPGLDDALRITCPTAREQLDDLIDAINASLPGEHRP
ncbi:MAG: pyridoxal phosphate-dependent aminotransferase [Phycisphaerales bacterium]